MNNIRTANKTKTKIETAFMQRPALIPFITCGDPDLETTIAAVSAAVANGAALVELGIPFSDPTAEGPVLQAANLRALNGGVTTDKIFTMVRELRNAVTVPLVFVTYANVVFSYGAERFIATCHEIGIDGLLVPDLPFEEKQEFLPFCQQYDVDLISQIASTSANRIAMIAKEADGFLYLANSPEGESDIAAITETVRQNSSVPCAVNASIATPEQAVKLVGLCDGIILDVALVKLLEQYGQNAPEQIGAYVGKMSEAIKEVIG